ncbi:MAG: PAS domain S-box protein [Burkholderiaceae bacterium]|nr:PAS domain S-box protein [Burkholderiaceae bacterium]
MAFLSDLSQALQHSGLPLLVMAIAAALVLAGVAAVLSVTGYRRLQSRALSGERRLQAIFETSMDGMMVTDGLGIVQSANRSAERLFGWSAEELIGKNINALMAEPNRSQYESCLAGLQHGGETCVIGQEAVGMRKDGSLMPMLLAIGKADLPEPVFVVFIENISGRRAMEEELRKVRNAAKSPVAEARQGTPESGGNTPALGMDTLQGHVVEALPAAGLPEMPVQGGMETVQEEIRRFLDENEEIYAHLERTIESAAPVAASGQVHRLADVRPNSEKNTLQDLTQQLKSALHGTQSEALHTEAGALLPHLTQLLTELRNVLGDQAQPDELERAIADSDFERATEMLHDLLKDTTRQPRRQLP